MPLVMLFLASNVFCHCSDAGFADTEHSVSSLPGEIRAPLLVNPTRGICFDDTSDFSRRVRWANAREHVHMIGRAVDHQRSSIHLADDAAEIGEQFWLKFGLDQRSALVPAENQVEARCFRMYATFSSPLQG